MLSGNPFMIFATSTIIFINGGMGEVRSVFSFYNNSLANFVLGIIYFFIIGCEFFIRYKINVRKKRKNPENDYLNKAPASVGLIGEDD